MLLRRYLKALEAKNQPHLKYDLGGRQLIANANAVFDTLGYNHDPLDQLSA